MAQGVSTAVGPPNAAQCPVWHVLEVRYERLHLYLANSSAVSIILFSQHRRHSSELRKPLAISLTMNYFFGGRKPALETVPGDQVRPLHFFENNLLVQGNNMSGLAVFDEVLDPEVLREALENVVKRPGWERLGGRLRKNVSIDYILSVVISVPLLGVSWLP